MGSKVLVILGMHRSGTSMVTHWLHACGLQVGEQLLGGGVGNVQGHFEDLELYWLHRRWLEHHRLPHTGFVAAPVPGFSAALKQQLRQLIAERNARHPQWGWKEPRTCLFLDDYRELLPDAHYAVIFRAFGETVSSMIVRIIRQKDQKHATRGGLRGWWWFNIRRQRLWHRLLRRDASRFLKSWIFYNQRILEGLRRIPGGRKVVVRFKSLVNGDDERLFDVLTKSWGFELHRVPARNIYRPRLTSKPLDLKRWIDASLWQEAEAVLQQLEGLVGAHAVAATPIHRGIRHQKTSRS